MKNISIILLLLTFTSLSSKGQETSQQLPFKNFSEIEIGSSFQVQITRGDSYVVEIMGSNDQFEGLEFSQEGKKLRIDLDKKRKGLPKAPRIRITMPALESLDLSGTIKAEIKGFNNESMQIDISGTASCKLDAQINNLKIDMSGAGNVELLGSGDLMVLNLSGAANIKAGEYQVKKLMLNMSGAGAAEVFVSEQLDLEVSGVGSVRYGGNPTTITKKISGMASIKALENEE